MAHVSRPVTQACEAGRTLWRRGQLAPTGRKASTGLQLYVREWRTLRRRGRRRPPSAVRNSKMWSPSGPEPAHLHRAAPGSECILSTLLAVEKRTEPRRCLASSGGRDT